MKHILHETNFINFLRIKMSQNSYLENSIPEFVGRCAYKSLYLNLYESKWVLAGRFIIT